MTAIFIYGYLPFFTRNILFLCLVICLNEMRPVQCTYDASIIRSLLADYDWKTRPIGAKESDQRKTGHLMVTVNILLRTISKIDDVNMEFSTQFTFRQSWNDRRLAYGARGSSDPSFEVDNIRPDNVEEDKKPPKFLILVPGDQSEHIWLPDTFFQNEKSAQKHLIDKPNVLIRIYPNGDVLYSVRLSVVLSCPMSLVFYPMDEQDCFIDFSSYAYTMDDIQYRWSNDSPIQMKDTVKTSLPSFDLGDVETKHCVSNTSTGEYSCLRVHLHFKRMFSYYLIQLYIPSFMLVIVSWVSFWVDKASVPARVTLGVTTLLTITTQASGINAKLPPVSYTKAIDVWIGVCLAFVFGALLEYALVNYADEGYLGRRRIYGRKPYRHRDSSGHPEISPSFCPACGLYDMNNQNSRLFLDCNRSRVQPATVTGRLNNSFRWSEDEERRSQLSPICCQRDRNPWLTTDSPFSLDIQGDTSCETDLNFKVVRSFADRRCSRYKTQKQPLYKRAGRWTLSLYNDADRAKKIDVISRVVFPTLFLCFNCIYWSVY